MTGLGASTPPYEPDFSGGFLRVPRGVWNALYCRAPLTRRQLQLVSVVLRESWGWAKATGAVELWTRPLTARQFAERTGLSTDHLTRDLRRLIERGILRQDRYRYHLVADPRLWTTPGDSAPNLRWPAPKSPAPTVETAPAALNIKKPNTSNRNRQVEPGSSGDNSQRFAKAAATIAAFVGPLSAEETAALRAWITAEGIAAAWRVVALNTNPNIRRTALLKALTPYLPTLRSDKPVPLLPIEEVRE